MKAILTIVKKELARVFTNKKLIAMLFAPGIMIFVLYTFMGVMFDKMFEIDSTVTHDIHIYNQSDGVSDFFDSFADLEIGYTLNFIEVEGDKDVILPEYKQMIEDNEIKVIIVLDDNAKDWFDNVSSSTGLVEIFYNGDSMDSLMMFSYLSSMFQVIEEEENGSPKLFTVNSTDTNYNLAGTISANPFTSMIPMLLITFLISGVMSVAVESIAGEKERGTLATILITPVSRFKIAIGKVLSVSIPATISGLISFIGLVLSLPNLTGEFELKVEPSMYVALAFVIFITVVVFVVVISLISALAKSLKEANQLTSPFMLITMIASLVIAFVTINSDAFYLIPIVNSILAIKGCLNSTLSLIQLAFVFISNIGIIAIGIYCLGKMFNSEKIMFNKG